MRILLIAAFATLRTFTGAAFAEVITPKYPHQYEVRVGTNRVYFVENIPVRWGLTNTVGVKPGMKFDLLAYSREFQWLKISDSSVTNDPRALPVKNLLTVAEERARKSREALKAEIAEFEAVNPQWQDGDWLPDADEGWIRETVTAVQSAPRCSGGSGCGKVRSSGRCGNRGNCNRSREAAYLITECRGRGEHMTAEALSRWVSRVGLDSEGVYSKQINSSEFRDLLAEIRAENSVQNGSSRRSVVIRGQQGPAKAGIVRPGGRSAGGGKALQRR